MNWWQRWDEEAAPLEVEETDGVSKKEVDAEIGKSLAEESVEKNCEKVFKEKENNTTQKIPFNAVTDGRNRLSFCFVSYIVVS